MGTPSEADDDLASFSLLSKLSTDEETLGFDLSAGERWIYPENYPVRDYQFNIVQAALYSNTLVCLPTGKMIKGIFSFCLIFFFYNFISYFKKCFRSGQDFHSSCYNVQLLAMVSKWQGALFGTDQTSGGTANQCLS